MHIRSDEVDPTGFEKSLSALKLLQSEFLAPVEKFIIDPYVVMYDCGSAMTLAGFVAKQRGAPVVLDQRMFVLKGIASGLDYLHGQHVVHGQLLPETVFVYPDLSVKLACFGLCAVSTAASRQTVPYVSPERLEGGAASEADDVYAFGTIAYALAVSAVAFDELESGEHPRFASHFFSRLSPPIGAPIGKEDDIVTALTSFHSMSPDELAAPLSTHGFMPSAFSRPSSLPSGFSFEFDGLQQFPSESLGGSRHSLTFSSLTPLGHQQQYLSQLDSPLSDGGGAGGRSGGEDSMPIAFAPTVSSLSLGTAGDETVGKLNDALGLKGKSELCCENKHTAAAAGHELSGLATHVGTEETEDGKAFLASYFIQGKRMRIPFLCEYGYGTIIERCWKQKPEKRPTAAVFIYLFIYHCYLIIFSIYRNC